MCISGHVLVFFGFLCWELLFFACLFIIIVIIIIIYYYYFLLLLLLFLLLLIVNQNPHLLVKQIKHWNFYKFVLFLCWYLYAVYFYIYMNVMV